MRNVLITGFEPFGGDETNPSEQAAAALDGRVIEGRRVVGRTLPCTFAGAIPALRRHLRALDPEVVICTGLASGRKGVSLERVAINVVDARIPDNAGAQPVDEPIVRTGPAACWTTLPIKAICAELVDAGVPAEISQTAGTFVCNQVFYGLMRSLSRRPGVRGGFVHIPATAGLASAAGMPTLPLDDVIRGLEIALATALVRAVDDPLGGGAIH